MDKLVAKGLTFMACHGVLEEEKKVPQRFIIDLELGMDLRPAGDHDRLEYTIDYSELFRCVKRLVEGNSYSLIERLAEGIADLVLKRFGPVWVEVTVYKPDAPIAGEFEYFAVIIKRFKQ